MNYLLITGIILAVLPLLIIAVLALVVFVSMVRDDDDMSKLLTFAMAIVMFGLFLIAVHYGVAYLI